MAELNVAEEEQHLEEILIKLQDALLVADERAHALSRGVKENKKHLWENKHDMDGAEKSQIRQSIATTVLCGDTLVAKRDRIAKLIDAPYFGRVDFAPAGHPSAQPFYIGVHSFSDDKEKNDLIYDWRAPVAGMFYDFELGGASYQAPTGQVSGEITLKRQYRIKESRLEFAIQSSLNIHDDILQKELSHTTDEKMKNIVATIQRDQNRIIRNDSSSVLIIQGVAGSGKTSIALHRIAYMLYRHRDTLSSRNVLIISPNRVFADYISNVLPELGEERILEVDFGQIARSELDNKVRFQTFFEQIAELLDAPSPAFAERIAFKSTNDILTKMHSFRAYAENEFFLPEDIHLSVSVIPSGFVLQRYKAHPGVPMLNRMPLVIRDCINQARSGALKEIRSADAAKIRYAVKKMFKCQNILKLYREFFAWMGKPKLFKTRKGGVLEYSDVFPLVYLKILVMGTKSFGHVKHVVVDEMQDYTPFQYAVLREMFGCKMTILGDANQSVNPYGSTTAADIGEVFTDADCVKLGKSYRSSLEITQFAQLISKNDELEPVERHGEKPVVIEVDGESAQTAAIAVILADFGASAHTSLGIICKTQRQADDLFERVSVFAPEASLLTPESKEFNNGITICTAHLAKGLEFDRVIVPYACSRTYRTALDRSMLYIACTRALHNLYLVHEGSPADVIAAMPEETYERRNQNA